MPGAPSLALSATESSHGDGCDPEAVDLAVALVRAGRVRDAVELVGSRVEHRAGGTCPTCAMRGLALLVEAHLALGDLPAARALASRVEAGLDHDGLAGAWAHQALGELAAACSDDEGSLALHLAAGDLAGSTPDVPWRPGATLALVRLGRRREALDLARTHHRHARAHETAYDVALALRTLSTVDPDAQQTHLRDALALLPPTSARLRAQVAADLAGLLALSGGHDEAVGLLRPVEAFAVRHDLTPLVRRVRSMLERLGEPPRRIDSEALAELTAAEQAVALLVVSGLTNRAVADQREISIKAVEAHLSRIYRKLHLTSRAGLVEMLGPADPDPAP